MILLLVPLNLKNKIKCQTGNDDINNFEIMVSLKYLGNFWRIFEMPLIKCKAIIRKLLFAELNYKTVCLLSYIYVKNTCKLNAIDLSKENVLDADLKAIQQSNFTGNIDREQCL